MIDIEKLNNAAYVEIKRNRFFGFSRTCKNGVGELFSIEIFEKSLILPKFIRKLSKHKTKRLFERSKR